MKGQGVLVQGMLKAKSKVPKLRKASAKKVADRGASGIVSISETALEGARRKDLMLTLVGILTERPYKWKVVCLPLGHADPAPLRACCSSPPPFPPSVRSFFELCA